MILSLQLAMNLGISSMFGCIDIFGCRTEHVGPLLWDRVKLGLARMPRRTSSVCRLKQQSEISSDQELRHQNMSSSPQSYRFSQSNSTINCWFSGPLQAAKTPSYAGGAQGIPMGSCWGKQRLSRRESMAVDAGNQLLLMGLPSGKRLHNYGKSPFFMGKLTINGHFQ